MTRFRALTFAVAAALAAAGPAAAANQVFVVGPAPGPGIDFTEVQSAIAAAGDGDIVLLKDVADVSVAIDGKGITLARHPASGAVDLLRLSIRNTSASQVVQVHGIHFQWSGSAVEDCAGPVLLQDSLFGNPSFSFPQPLPPPMLAIVNSPRAALIRSVVRGESNLPTAALAAPGTALRIVASSVAVYRGELRGADAADFESLYPNFLSVPVPGAAGVELVSGTLFAGGVVIRGGAGGAGGLVVPISQCYSSQSGGAGILVGGAVTLLGADVAGGPKGDASGGCPDEGVSGAATAVLSGSVVTIPEPLRSISATGPVAVGTSTLVQVLGVPGEPAFLLKSPFLGAQYVPQMKGLLLPAPPWVFVPIGTLPPSGTLSFSAAIPAGSLPAGIEGLVEYVQLAVPGANGTGVLSSPTALVIVQ